MADTSTYKEIWSRYEKLLRSYNSLVKDAFDNDATLAQYAGSQRLSELVNSINQLLDKCSNLAFEPDLRKAQAATIALLYSVEEACADARLFECDPAANFEDYVSSRPCPTPKIITV